MRLGRFETADPPPLKYAGPTPKSGWAETKGPGFTPIRKSGIFGCADRAILLRPSKIVMVKWDFLKVAHAAGLYRIAIFGHKSGPYQINTISRLNWIPGGIFQ